MSLIDLFVEQCVMVVPKNEPDGEGGVKTTWTDGSVFNAAVTFNDSLEARKAEKTGVTSLYTVTTVRGMSLKYHDVFRRLRDGKVFRVTSDGDDIKTPKISSIRPFSQVTAEEWKLT